MARKPMIEEGSILAPQADLMSRVIGRDRAQSGRETGPPEAKSDPSFEDANITSNITDNITISDDAQSGIQDDVQKAAKPRVRQVAKLTEREDALQYARELLATVAQPITLRMPEGLNDYLDETAHEHRKARVKKQDLVSAAVQLLVIELRSGRDISDLLAELGTRR